MANELKVVIGEPDDLVWAEQQASSVSSGVDKLLQPEWTSSEGQQLAINYVLAHADWRIGLQTHKFLEVR